MDPYGYPPHYMPTARASYPYAGAALRYPHPGHAVPQGYGRAGYGGAVGAGYGYPPAAAGGAPAYYGGGYGGYRCRTIDSHKFLFLRSFDAALEAQATAAAWLLPEDRSMLAMSAVEGVLVAQTL